MRSNRFMPGFFTPDDLANWSPETDLGTPGEFPFTRGIQPTMYRGRPWTMRQYAGFGSAEQSNARYRYLLAQGVTGLSVAFDLPTQMGYDSDHLLAAGEVGRVGVAIDSIDDMERLFDQIPLDQVSTSMTINATAIILLALYVVAARRRGLSPASLAGTVQNDILKEYIARGTHIYPPRPSLRIVTDIFEFCDREMPKWNTISISGYHIREAGSTAVQEVAFTFANAIAYVEAALARGMDVNRVGRQISFFFNAHSDFLEEVAKFRAARRLWARIMRDRFGASDPRAEQLRFHAQTAGSTLTVQQPDNNIVRVALCRRSPPSSAGRSRSTATVVTRRWRSPPRNLPGPRCGRNRLSRPRAASRTPSIRLQGRTPLNRQRTGSKPRPARSSIESPVLEVRSPPSNRAGFRVTFRNRRMPRSRPSTRANESSSA
jgi:methylmalonyl-CoA mutase N-terminal domain/subunit